MGRFGQKTGAGFYKMVRGADGSKQLLVLDWKTGEKVLRLVLDLHERKGLSSILVTHNEKIARFCHKVYMMEAGTMKPLAAVPS